MPSSIPSIVCFNK
jgi:hypothetical protein